MKINYDFYDFLLYYCIGRCEIGMEGAYVDTGASDSLDFGGEGCVGESPDGIRKDWSIHSAHFTEDSDHQEYGERAEHSSVGLGSEQRVVSSDIWELH
jgi:hypothetical protein